MLLVSSLDDCTGIAMLATLTLKVTVMTAVTVMTRPPGFQPVGFSPQACCQGSTSTPAPSHA